jgi:hypothetical protein
MPDPSSQPRTDPSGAPAPEPQVLNLAAEKRLRSEPWTHSELAAASEALGAHRRGKASFATLVGALIRPFSARR